MVELLSTSIIVCVISLKDMDNHLNQNHKIKNVEEKWNFEGSEKDLNETFLCLSSYYKNFYAKLCIEKKLVQDTRSEDPIIYHEDKYLHFKVISFDHEVNTIPFDVNMTFFLRDGKNISMNDRVYPSIKRDQNKFCSVVNLKKITEFFDKDDVQMKKQDFIKFKLQIVKNNFEKISDDVLTSMYS